MKAGNKAAITKKWFGDAPAGAVTGNPLTRVGGSASGELKAVLSLIPGLREAVVGGQLARLAVGYLQANAAEHVKEDAAGAWSVAVQGRFQAFKNWAREAWAREPRLATATADYEDFLALYPPGEETTIGFTTFLEATRAPLDRGDFETYKTIMNRMGHVADKGHYISVRQ